MRQIALAATLLAIFSLGDAHATTINTTMVNFIGGTLGAETLLGFSTGSGHHSTNLVFEVGPPVDLNNLSNRVRHTLSTLDIDIDWFVAQQGQEFTAQNIAGGQFDKIPFGGSLVPFPSTPRYVAFHVTPIPQLYETEMFGWLEVKYVHPKMELVSQATVINGKGIVIGTTAIVPEPSSLTLMASILPLFAFHRLAKSRLSAAAA